MFVINSMNCILSNLADISENKDFCHLQKHSNKIIQVKKDKTITI